MLGKVYLNPENVVTMTSKFNPYNQWLDLDTNFIKPHYFELFGLNPTLKDQAEITRIVDAAAKRCLKLLAAVPSGENDKLVEEIQERVLRAQKTLSNPKTRLAYYEKLKSKTRKRSTPIAKTSDPSLSPPVKGKKSGKQKPKYLNQSETIDRMPPVPPKVVTAVTPIPDSPTNVPAAPMAAKPVAVAPPSSLPMAIPLAKPLPQQPVEPEDPISAGIKGLNINRKIRRRRSSKRFALLVLFLMFATLAGGTYLIIQNWSVFENLSELANAKVPTAVDQSNEGSSGGTQGGSLSEGSDVDSRPLPKIDLTNLDELDEEAIKDEERAARMEKNNRDKDDKSDGEDVGVASMNDQSDEKDSDTTEMKEPGKTVLVKFNDSQMAQYQRYLNRARYSLFRRDKARAKRAIESAQRVKDSVSEEPGSEFVTEQAEVAGLVDELAEIYELFDGFWEQVVSSCAEIPGGQELNVSNQILGLVESDQEKVIVRNAGSNITYQYSFLPPQLAVVLAKQGSIKDIPTWNKQLAAFYAVNQVHGKSYASQIDVLLKESEAAGHSCQRIRHFADFDFDVFDQVNQKVPFPNKKAQQDGISGFRTQQEYEAVTELSAGRALMAAQALEDQLTDDIVQNVVFLEEIRKLGMRSGDSGIVDDAIREIGNLSQVNVANLWCDSYLVMADSELSVSQRRGLMEVAIPFLKSDLGQKSKLKTREQLVQALSKLAQVYGMADAARRLNQVEL